MKTFRSGLLIISLFALATFSTVFGQTHELKSFTEDGYSYQMEEGDPTQTRIYKLANGLTVYLSVYKDKPQIFTLIPVRAGSKNDPHDNTGLAHYLEHMVFKGTSMMGAKDYVKEKVLLDSIEHLFNRYRKLKDPIQRKALYKKIDAVSLEASKLCYANEYDKLLSVLGASGTNAFTSNEVTAYMNSIPSNQLEKWLKIEAERFGELTPRLFHTELEAVYEEKNMSLDEDGDKVQETLDASLYKKHPYGTQTTIGTVEHLKNPSITEIKKFFYTYYVPNNMAICLAGDLDPAKTIKLIDQTFGKLSSKPVPTFKVPVEDPITKPILKKVIGPEEEGITLGFRLPGFGTKEARMARLMDQMLQNSQAGLIDLNLNQKQLVLSAGAYLDVNKDYSSHIFYGNPKQGQTLDEVRKLIFAQIDSIKKGKFENWLIPAIVNNIKINELRKYDNNQGRAFTQLSAFSMNANWADIWKETDLLSKITKPEIMAFANQYYGNGYVEVQKLTGKDPNVVKVEKPSITPVVLNKSDNSEFYKKINAVPSPPIEPQFLDFKKDLTVQEWKPGIEILYKKNTATPLFQLTYLVEMGSNHNPKLDLAARLLDLSGAKDLSAGQFKKELFKLGTDISVFPGVDQTYITVSGLQENFDASVRLLESLVNEPKGDPAALKGLTANVLKERQNQLLDKRAILYSGLAGYAKYGTVSPARNVVKNKDLQQLTVDELLGFTRKLTSYPHKILYYGPAEVSDLSQKLNALHSVPPALVLIPPPMSFKELETDSNRVFWTDYDMVQTELYFLSKSVNYDPNLVVDASLYNEYMGGNMSSVVFQELRESKALAYSADGSYRMASELNKPNYITSYIGCQSDKLPDAMSSMLSIMNDLPVVENSFNLSKASIINGLRSERTTKSSILFAYLRARKLGLDEDIRAKVFAELPLQTMESLKSFHAKLIQNRKYHLALIGKRDKINFEALRKFGPVKELKVEELFGY